MALNLSYIFSKSKHILFTVVLPALVLFSCSKYQKVLKSSDLNYKHTMALKYYENGDYVRAYPIFEELYGLWRGTAKAEEVYRYYAYCSYYADDLMLASYYFKNFTKTFPSSKYSEECLFMSAYCYYLNSPTYSLDPTNTETAIRELQLFTNIYTKSSRIEECNTLIDELRYKLETKAYKTAKLYYHLDDYKAAEVAFNDVINDFPDTKYREELTFLILKARYNLAIRSIEDKKKERLQTASKSYNIYVAAYPEGNYAKEAMSIYENTLKELKKLNPQNSNNDGPQENKS